MSQSIRIVALLAFAAPLIARAGCEIVDGDKKMPFDGSSLNHLLVEKRSLVILNALFPRLNVIERTFKGEVLTCTSCSEPHVRCSR